MLNLTSVLLKNVSFRRRSRINFSKSKMHRKTSKKMNMTLPKPCDLIVDKFLLAFFYGRHWLDGFHWLDFFCAPGLSLRRPLGRRPWRVRGRQPFRPKNFWPTVSKNNIKRPSATAADPTKNEKKNTKNCQKSKNRDFDFLTSGQCFFADFEKTVFF